MVEVVFIKPIWHTEKRDKDTKKNKKNVAYHINLQHQERTLKDSEAEEIITKISLNSVAVQKIEKKIVALKTDKIYTYIISIEKIDICPIRGKRD